MQKLIREHSIENQDVNLGNNLAKIPAECIYQIVITKKIVGTSPFSVKDNNILSGKERCKKNNHIMEYYKQYLDL